MFLGEKCVFLTISESKIRKKSKFLLNGYSIGTTVAYKISGINSKTARRRKVHWMYNV